MARVVYRLAPQVSQSSASTVSSYVLLRQESSNLDFEAFKKEQNTPGAIRAVEVMRDIKSLKIMYTAEIIKRPDQAQKKEHAQERSYKKMTEWQREPKETEQKEDDDQFKDVPSILPRLVTVELTVWDAQHKRDKTFSTTILIPTDTVIQISEHKREQLKTDEESAMAVAFGPEVARKEGGGHIIQIRTG
jgi:hypothetical protein